MAPNIEVDAATHRSLELAARLTGVSVGSVVSRLVSQAVEAPAVDREARSESEPPGDGKVTIYADYMEMRTHAEFEPASGRIQITTGPLAGKAYGTPSQAAVAVVRHYKPEVDPNRNGWTFWVLDDGSGRRLQSIRES